LKKKGNRDEEEIFRTGRCACSNKSYFSNLTSGGFAMQMKKIKEIAKKNGVTPGTMSRTELIRAIQRAEGNPDCFATMHVNDCKQTNCLWRVDCKAEVIAQADVPIVSSCV
jgi:hypothetical protein